MVASAPTPLRTYRTRLDRDLDHAENVRFIRNVRRLGRHAEYGGQYEPVVAAEAGRQLIRLAERRMAQVGGTFDDAA